jgi:methyl-accepting chemotaxis protein
VVSTSTTEIEKMTRAFEQGSALAPTLRPVLDTISENVNAVSQRIDHIKNQSDALAQRVNNSLADEGRMLGGLEDVQARIVQAGQTARDAITREGDATRRVLEGTRTDMEQMLEGGRQMVAERFNGEISAATDRLSNILRDFAAKIEEARGGATR